MAVALTFTAMIEAALRDLFGHTGFRSGQQEIIEAVLSGKDTLAVLPTGGGKSVTYQLPAMLLPGATLILSPLIALMKDQVESLPPPLQDRVALINSSLEGSEVGRRLALLRSGQLKLIYAAPERLRQPPFLHALRQAGLSLLVIDEAHCISQWGHDFRPDYRAVGQAVAALGPKTVLAVTATAPPDVQQDIERQLGRPLQRLLRPTWRENLTLSVVRVPRDEDKLFATLEICQREPGCGLIYASSRDRCEEIARMLRRHGVSAGFYHAGLEASERAAAQDRFMSGEVRVMAATVAFGMGVDKPDIRFLLHYSPSRTLENYYQEAGRAGRDGQPAHCILLYTSFDLGQATRLLNSDTVTNERVRGVYQALRTVLGRRRCGAVAWTELVAACDGEEGLVRSALPILEELGLLRRHVDLPRQLTLYPSPIDEGLPPSPLAEALLAERGGEPEVLAAAAGIPLPELEATILQLQSEGYLTYRGAPRDLCLELLAPPADTKARLEERLKHRAEGAAHRAAAMRAYAEEKRCRHQQIARYFGDRWPHRNCGHCDICAPQAVLSEKRTVGDAAEASPLAALQLVHELATGYRPFALGRAGLLKALRGTPDAPIKPGRSSAFGALASWKKAEVERLMDALVAQGYLDRADAEDDEYRRLSMTALGRAALESGELDIEWRAPSVVATAVVAVGDADLELLAALKRWRREQAELAAQPPYVIFSDKTLEQIAARKPVNEFELLDIVGIGPAKAARFGDAMLELVQRHGR